MKQVAYLTGSRADFGLMEKILAEIESEKKLKLLLLATGMHLLKEFGKTFNDIQAKFPGVKVIDSTYEEDSRLSMARFLGRAVSRLAETLTVEKPDYVLVLGDRAEQLAMAQTAAYLNIPVIHLHGGEITGTVDDKARNAISFLADRHLPATKKAAKKLRRMGIDKHRIKIVGAPGLDDIKTLSLPGKKDCLTILQHPDEDEAKAAWQIRQTLEAVIEFKLPVKIIYPNADAGGRSQIAEIKNFTHQYPELIEVFPSLDRRKFLTLLSRSRVFIGNSSGGLIEAPAFNLPFVNVGPRQKGREQAKNVINVKYSRQQIIKAVSRALSWRLKNINSPYGDGQTAPRVIKFLNQL